MTPESVRAGLLASVARGRPVLPVQARPAPGRPAPLPQCLEGLEVEELEYRSDESPQGWVPLRLARAPAQAPPQGQQQQGQQGQEQQQEQGPGQPESSGSGGGRLPVVLLLHATGVDRDSLAERQAALARRGYLAAAIDCRYHGRRADPAHPGEPWEGYQQALVRALREGPERPFLLDNVWDVLRLLDYLGSRADADVARVGVTGVSLGGMHAWLAAAADPRVAVAAPMIGVQGFRWALDHGSFMARVESIPHVFAAAAADMGRPGVDAEVAAGVWCRLLPGLLDVYDAPLSLGAVAPRPLLVINGERDPRCPIEGVRAAVAAAAAAYEAAGAPQNLRLFEDPGVGHECTEAMWRQVDAWMDAHLLGAAPP